MPPQPPIPAFGQASQETRKWAGNAGLSHIQLSLWTLGLSNSMWKS
jgi:hypothetical protein